MSYKTINTIGTGYSGASAIYEFLQQTNLFYDPFPNSQFSISYDPGGLQDLENVINTQFTINKSTEAYNNFIELINFYCGQNKGLKIGKNLTKYNTNLKYLLTNFLNNIVILNYKGETAFTSIIKHQSNSVSIVDASISSIKYPDCFAQTLVNIEFENGSIDLDFNYKICLHTKNGKKFYNAKPKKLSWISKPWDQIQESIVNTHKHFMYCLQHNKEPDTSGDDNIKSLTLVFASYKSNKLRKEIKV